MIKKISIFIISIAIIGIISYQYIYQDHRDISSEKVDSSLLSSELIDSFKNNSKSAEQNYLNKTIIVSGIITEQSKATITLDDMIFCSFINEKSKTLNIRSKVFIKGRCIGYDDLLEQVKIDQCTIIE